MSTQDALMSYDFIGPLAREGDIDYLTRAQDWYDENPPSGWDAPADFDPIHNISTCHECWERAWREDQGEEPQLDWYDEIARDTAIGRMEWEDEMRKEYLLDEGKWATREAAR